MSPPAPRRRAAFLLAAFAIGLLVARTFLVVPVRVTTSSMSPTILPGDLLLAWRPGPVRAGDVVAVRMDGRLRVKRVVGVGEEVVELADGRLYVDGRPASPGAGGAARRRIVRLPGGARVRLVAEARGGRCWWVVPGGDHPRRRLAPGTLWVLGDDRPASSDSRQWGPVREEDVVGRARWRWRPSDLLSGHGIGFSSLEPPREQACRDAAVSASSG